jgi:hypothetical protein
MRYLGCLSAALFVLSVGASFAQGLREYVSRDEFFMVGMPAEPHMTETTYPAASGAILPAKVFVATEGQRVSSVTVVHYMNASAADVESAVEHAVQSFRSRPGEVTYDSPQRMEGLPGHMIYLLNPDQSRTAAGIFLHAGPSEHGGPGRLYILEGVAAAGAPPPIQFPQSFFLLDAAGNRLDYDTDANGRRVRNDRGQQTGVGAAYAAREPVSCQSRAEPAQGRPTAGQVAQYLKCAAEGVADGTLYLLEDVEVREVGEGEYVDASYYPDIDAAHPVFPVRGNLVRYTCRRENGSNAGSNCVSHVEANASGSCYKATSGDWNCSLSDLVQRTTEQVAPPQ